MNGRSIIRAGYTAIVMIVVAAMMVPATLAAHEPRPNAQGAGFHWEDSH